MQATFARLKCVGLELGVAGILFFFLISQQLEDLNNKFQNNPFGYLFLGSQ